VTLSFTVDVKQDLITACRDLMVIQSLYIIIIGIIQKREAFANNKMMFVLRGTTRQQLFASAKNQKSSFISQFQCKTFFFPRTPQSNYPTQKLQTTSCLNRTSPAATAFTPLLHHRRIQNALHLWLTRKTSLHLHFCAIIALPTRFLPLSISQVAYADRFPSIDKNSNLNRRQK
jgi:hypothetical protein